MIQPCSRAVLPEAMMLLTSMTDINFGMRSSTKSRGCHRIPRSCTWNGISTTASLNGRLESVYSTTKFRPRMREMNSSTRSRSPVLDTTNKKYDPTNPRHPSRNEFLHRTAVESGSKRKADSLEAGGETNGTDAHNAKWLKTVSNGAVTRPHSTAEDASKAHIKPPQDIPEVQFAGYNAEMLCAPTVKRQHTIGVLNEGQCQGFFLRAAANAISQTNTCTFGGLITRAQSGQRP